MACYGILWSGQSEKLNKKVAFKTFKLYKNILRIVETAFALGDA